MTVSINAAVSSRIRSELKARNIPLSVVATLAGYATVHPINLQLRLHVLQPRTVEALNKCLIDL